MTAQPVAAATASEHTTFGTGGGEPSPASLTNAEVQGSGTGASVVSEFEARQSYNPGISQGGGGFGDSKSFIGDTGGTDGIGSEVRIQPTFNGSIDKLTYTIASTKGSDYGATVDVYISEGVFDSSLTDGTKVASFDPDWTAGETTIELDTEFDVTAGKTYGVQFVTSSGDGDADDDALMIQTDDSANTIYYQFNGNNADSYADLQVVDSAKDGEATGATHDASDVTAGEVDLTLSDAEATVRWQEDGDNDGNWNTVSTATYTSGGTKSQSLSGTSADRWRAVVDFSTNSPATATAELNAERVLADSDPPAGSNPQPSSQDLISQYDGDISLEVTDPDFGLPQSDSVTVSAANTNGQIGQTTIGSNETVEIDYTPLAGDNNITWTLTDSYGGQTTVQQSFESPQTLQIRNASQPGQLVNGSSNEVTVRFFGAEDTVIEKTTTTGEISLAGLPAAPDDGYRVTVDPSGNYSSRTIVLQSLLDQNDVYLLPSDTSPVTVEFQVEDQTGQFDRQSILYVERPITRNGNTSYRTVTADEFGVSGLTAQLVPGTRYRLRMDNQRGDSVVLGSYTPSVSEVVTLRPQPGVIGITDDESGLGYRASLSNQTLVVDYRDPSNSSDVTLAIVERGNHSNRLVPNQTYDNLGNLTYQTTLTANETNQSWVVLIQGTRQESQPVDVRLPVGQGRDLLPGELSFAWQFGIVTFVLCLSAGLWGQFSVGLGATVTGMVGGLLWWFGFLSGIGSAAAVAIAISVGVMARLYEGGGR
jgi:hypothetical protein